MKFKIKEHSGIDKFFGAGNSHIWMRVDYDDVNHTEVDAAILYMKEIMEEHWNEKMYESHYMNQVLKEWDTNEYNLQADYDNNKEQYLKEKGITVYKEGKI